MGEGSQGLAKKKMRKGVVSHLQLLSLYAGQSLGHQLLVDSTEVGHLFLAFMMDVHTALWKKQDTINTITMLATGLCWTICYVIIHIELFILI